MSPGSLILHCQPHTANPSTQIDNHTGALTVEETLAFAHVCQNGLAPPDFDIHDEILQAKVGLICVLSIAFCICVLIILVALLLVPVASF